MIHARMGRRLVVGKGGWAANMYGSGRGAGDGTSQGGGYGHGRGHGPGNWDGSGGTRWYGAS